MAKEKAAIISLSGEMSTGGGEKIATRISCDSLHGALFTVCRVCSEGVLCILIVGCGLRVGLGEAEPARVAAGMLSCSMLLERPPFTSLPTLLRPMEEKKRRRKSLGRPSSFLYMGYKIYFSRRNICVCTYTAF